MQVHDVRRRRRDAPERAPAEDRVSAAPPSVEALLALQRGAGNQAVARLAAQRRMLQRAFWEKQGSGYIWHDEEPDEDSFERVMENGKPASYGATTRFWTYPLYQRRAVEEGDDETTQRPDADADTEVAAEQEPSDAEQPSPTTQAAPRRERRAKRQPIAQTPVPPIQDEKGRLLTQVGPSCWLFVVEAMAHAKQIDTRMFSAVINLHPAGAEAKDLTRAQEANVIVTRLQKLHGALSPKAKHYAWFRFQKIAARELPAVHADALNVFVVRLLAGAPHEDPGYRADAVHARVVEAIAVAVRLRAEIDKPAQPGIDDESKLLGGAVTQVDDTIDDTNLGVVIAGVLQAGSGVAMMGISQRFKPDQYKNDARVTTDKKTYDFTKISADEIKEGNPHAVLLIGYDPSTNTVKYRDPHQGDAVMIITFGHIRKMAQLWQKVEFYGMHGDEKRGIRSIL